MREIKEIIVHCSATLEGLDVTLEQIDNYHRSLGWNGCGYHYVITLDGNVHIGRPVNVQGAHCKDGGHNVGSIGVCYVGGLASDGKTPKDTRTSEQKRALIILLRQLHSSFPDARLYGHRDFAAKACPCFDVHKEYKYIFGSLT